MDLISVYCPYCGRHTSVSEAPLTAIDTRTNRRVSVPGGSYKDWWIAVCNFCAEPMLVNGRGFRIYPPPQPAPVSKHVPEPMRGDLTEAKKCFSVSAFNAAATMARRALQSCAVAHGADRGKKLWEQVKWLAGEGHITKKQKNLATAVRWIGNDGAHDNSGDDEPTGVTSEDAQSAIELVEQLFNTMYDAEAMTNEQFTKRGKTPR